jgi:nucleoside-diphosphate-sugar epimerase
MTIVLFGATGMVGQGALRECLLDESVSEVVTVGRTPTGRSHPRLKERAASDLFDLSALDLNELGSLDSAT